MKKLNTSKHSDGPSTNRSKRRYPIGLIMSLVFAVCTGLTLLMLTWGRTIVNDSMFPGKLITSINDYDEVRDVIQDGFPFESRFLPPSIPTNAYNERIDASSRAGMQASPWLKLDFDLPAADAQAELARLRSLQPTDVTHTGYMFSSQSAQYAFDDDLIVLGFLSEFVPDYRTGQASAPERVAFVTYEPSTGHFHYEFNSD